MVGTIAIGFTGGAKLFDCGAAVRNRAANTHSCLSPFKVVVGCNAPAAMQQGFLRLRGVAIAQSSVGWTVRFCAVSVQFAVKRIMLRGVACLMKTNVKALVVGGGAVGTSIAYHLAKAGWDDVMLIERDELTSGSTWHAAGLLPLFNMSYATTHIHQYSVDFYKTLEEETGLNAGFAVVGNLRMAQTQDRMDEFMLYASTAETCGVKYEWLSPEQHQASAGR